MSVEPGEVRSEVAAGDPALIAFLSDRDEPCPACGYNLRGVEASQCPECGGPLRLSLARRQRLGGWAPLLLLVFGWLFLAGGMNSYRQVRVLQETQLAQQQAASRVGAIRSQLQAQIKSLQQPVRDPFEGLADRFPGMGSMREFQNQAMQDMNAMLARQLQAPLAKMPAPGNTAPPTLLQTFQGSPWRTQAATVWAFSLTALSLLGLVLLGAAWARGWTAARGLVAMALALFACYGGWHIVAFVGELR